MDFILKFEYPPVEERIIFPANELVNNWIFRDDTIDEAHLCHYIGVIVQKNGLYPDDLHALFPAILRMLHSEVDWAVRQNK